MVAWGLEESVPGRQSPKAQMWNGSTEQVLPLQGALRESCALGAGGLLRGSGLGKTCMGKGAARSLHLGGLGRQRGGSSAVGGVQVRVLVMVLEAGAAMCWSKAQGSVGPCP